MNVFAPSSLLRSSMFQLLLLGSLVSTATVLHASEPDVQKIAAEAHAAIMEKVPYPSATECATCHPDQFREWAASPHAYAQLSPVFNAMHMKLVKDSNGTLGDFCIRCHTPVGMELGEPVNISNLDRHPVSREGVTCVTCHRTVLEYGKVSSRIGLEAGSITHPVYGPNGNEELKRVIESTQFNVEPTEAGSGRKIHQDAIKNDQIATSAFCGSCHDVNNVTGFRLEEAFSDYITSPAAAKGISCQDCHMGIKPGEVSGYEHKPVAVVAGIPTKPRKHANHRFIGPDYSIVHPGIFPHNPGAAEFATMREWLEFDYKAGWGTPDFEDSLTGSEVFPERWKAESERFEARAFLESNLEVLKEADEQRLALLRVGYKLGQARVLNNSLEKLEFEIDVENGTDGHSVPTGFDAERIVFLRVTIADANGAVVLRSGDLDPNGDLRDTHSQYVHNGVLPVDPFLVNLQSQFLVELVRGSERKQILTTNFSQSPLPFIRPPTNATMLLGRGAGARKFRQVIPPGGRRTGRYVVEASELSGKSAPFTAHVQLIAGMVPVNLIFGIQEVGFDFGMSPREVADAVVAGHQVLWEQSITLDASGATVARVEAGGLERE